MGGDGKDIFLKLFLYCKTFNYLRIRLQEPEQDENKIQGWTISTQNKLQA